MSFLTESGEFARRNALHKRGWGRKYSYSARRYCNPPPGTPMARSRLFYSTHFISPAQAKTLLRKKLLMGKMFKGVMFICINPEYSGMDVADLLEMGGC